MDILDLPEEMIERIAYQLDYKSLMNLITTHHMIHQRLRNIVGKRTMYVASRDLMCYGQIPSYLTTLVKHIYIGFEWNRLQNPFTSLVSCLRKREHPGEDILSVHVNGVTPRMRDINTLLKFAPNIKQFIFGVYKHKLTNNKTLAIQTNFHLGDCAELFKGIKKIIVRPCGPASSEFKENLEKLVSINITTLTDIDFQFNIDTYFPIDIPRGCRLQSLLTNSAMSTFLPDLDNIGSLRSMECSLTNQVPIWRFIPNLLHVKLHIMVDNWEFRDISKFFPNLRTLDLESVYIQNGIPEDEKPVLPHLTMINGKNFAVVLVENFIAPELTDVFISPLSRNTNNHLIKNSKNIRNFLAIDNLIDDNKIAVIKEIVIQHRKLEYAKFTHNRLICACELMEFAVQFQSFLKLRAQGLHIEFMFEMDSKFKRRLVAIFTFSTGWEMKDFGTMIIIKVTRTARLIVNFRDIYIANLIINNDLNIQ